MVGKQGRSKKKKVKYPEIIMAHIPNAGMGSVKRKHWKLLETNTLPLGRNHMHLQTNNAKTHTLSQQIESWQISQCFYTTNRNIRQLFTT